MIISADIGGTKTSIGVSAPEEPVTYLRQTTYMNADFDNFTEIVRDFSSKDEVSIMVLGIAGPIAGRRVELTNLDWSIDADELETEFECKVYLLNDLQAAAHTVPYLRNEDAHLVYSSNESSSTVSTTEVIVSVGTGLGVAKIFQASTRIVFASEGGHIGFSPHSPFQQQLFDFINERVDHVSYEMMVSSIGFRNLRRFILEKDEMGFSDEFIEILKKTPDIPRLLVKTSAMASPDSEICQTILSEFSFMLGCFLGDMVLVHLPSSIYLTGGIGRNIPLDDRLRKGFLTKANMSHVVKKASLKIITDPDCALHGTSWFAYENL